MRYIRRNSKFQGPFEAQFRRSICACRGFTLLELVVAMAVSGIVLLGIYTSHSLQQDTLRNQSMVVDIQQNLRGALTLIQQDLLMAGYDPNNSGEFGITQITRFRDNARFEFNGDFGDGAAAENGTADINAGESIAYYLWDFDETETDGDIDLCRDVDGNRNLMATGIEAMEVAFAFDNDGDGELDNNGGAVIWAIDSDGDGVLDSNLDDNADGQIDLGDTPGGVPLADVVDPDAIRAVRIWLLGRTESVVLSRQYTDQNTYVVGGRRITPDDKFQRRLLTTTIRLRNMGI
jgi:type IV pilus assembly protein PilW